MTIWWTVACTLLCTGVGYLSCDSVDVISKVVTLGKEVIEFRCSEHIDVDHELGSGFTQ